MNEIQPILTARGLFKRYGTVVALNGADFDLNPGEILAVIGDNGAGKSTLIKAISGAIIPDHGTIEIEGKPVNFRSPDDARKAGIETVYQNLALSPALSIADNMFLGRELRKAGILGTVFRMMDRSGMQKFAREKLSELGLMTIQNINQAVETLSGGQRQGVAVARAAAFGSKIIILDEPTAALGVKESRRVLELILDVRSRGIPIILISHNMPHVFEVADRIHIHRLGKRIAVIKPRDYSMSDAVAIMTGAMKPPEEGAAGPAHHYKVGEELSQTPMTMQRALVLEKQHELTIRDIDLPANPGPGEVKIKLHTVGVCGSDVHYYTHGRIGPFVVNAPMVLGHEAAGTVVEVGAGVTGLKVGDRVCMEPGVPDPNSRAARLGMYNIDPAVTFWATPPIHGVLTPFVVHPANYTFKLPDNVSFAEGAMVEPFAVGMQAATKAKITPGDTAIVMGAGPIGTMVALAALAGGCSRVIITDLAQPKLDIAAQYQGIIPVNIRDKKLLDEVNRLTDGWGADVIFECSGSPRAWAGIVDVARPGGTIVVVGLPVEPVDFDIASLSIKEITITSVFRYAHQYDRAIALMASGRVDLKPLISETFSFEDSIKAFDRAVEARPTDVKLQILMDA